MELNPSVARSLEEGLKETLTVRTLRVPDQLRRTLFLHQRDRVRLPDRFAATSNSGGPAIRSNAGLGRGLPVAERQFRKVIGHHHIPLLPSSLATTVSDKSIAKGAAVG